MGASDRIKNATWVCSAIRKLQKGECGVCACDGICNGDESMSDMGYVEAGYMG